MPCDSGSPSHSYLERGRLNDALNEIESVSSDRPESIDAMTARLCEWCQTHDVTHQSLEFQLWWQKHQQRDAQRKEREAIDAAKKSTQYYLMRVEEVIKKDPVGFAVTFCKEFYPEELKKLMTERSLSYAEAALILMQP